MGVYADVNRGAKREAVQAVVQVKHSPHGWGAARSAPVSAHGIK